MQNIKLDTLGKITQGEYTDWSTIIKHDQEHTDGYYIFISKIPYGEFPNGYDDWVETYPNLQNYLKKANWNIQWEG